MKKLLFLAIFIICATSLINAQPDSIKKQKQTIKQLVTGLNYSPQVAEDFEKMITSWIDDKGKPVLEVFRNKLTEAQKQIKDVNKLADIERELMLELDTIIKSKILPIEGSFDLTDIIKNTKADCIGYSQLLYIFGNYIGLKVDAIEVTELNNSYIQKGWYHTANIAYLSNNSIVMIDLAYEDYTKRVSEQFLLEKTFDKVDNFWEIKDKSNPLDLHRRFRILNYDGIIAGICNSRGNIYDKQGNYDEAIEYFNKAIELDPNFATAYNNRGVVYKAQGNNDEAIKYDTKAIKIDSKYALAYYNRGLAYGIKGNYDEVIRNFTKAIELDTNDTEAYYGRGLAYGNKGNYDEAIKDYSEAIKINPNYADAYFSRGSIYFQQKKEYELSIADFKISAKLGDNDARTILKILNIAY